MIDSAKSAVPLPESVAVDATAAHTVPVTVAGAPCARESASLTNVLENALEKVLFTAQSSLECAKFRDIGERNSLIRALDAANVAAARILG